MPPLNLLNTMNPDIEKFWAEVEAIFASQPPDLPVEIEYRLHYDQAGTIHMCSMTNHPESDRYLVVTKDEYDNFFDYYIVNDQLKKIDRNPLYRVQLKQSAQGFCVVQNHAGLILEPTEEYPHIEYYEYNHH